MSITRSSIPRTHALRSATPPSNLGEVSGPRSFSKFKNKWEVVDGIKFRSKREARRYSELKLLLAAGAIERLELQPRYPMKIDGILICTYVADFRYITPGQGTTVEDVKGMRTYVYTIKKKLMKALYHIDVVEV